MATITKNTDGDTFRIDDEPTRILGINTDESVAVNAGRNSASGEAASAKAKTILPEGSEVGVSDAGKGKFGRTLGDVTIKTAHGDVDFGLVALDQGMSKYSIDYGTHPDPEQHDKFKEYFSENSPYQYADNKKPLTPEEYNAHAKAIEAYTKAEVDFENGDIPRDAYELALHTAYGDGDKVARFRYQNKDWERKFEMSKYDGTDRMAYDWAMQSDENKEAYDKAMRSTHTGGRSNPEQEQGFFEALFANTKTSFSALNDFAVVGRQHDLSNARQFGSDDEDISDDELLRGVPEQFKVEILQEAAKYGSDAALQRRDNLLVDLENEADIAAMPLGMQIATAIPAVLASPMTVIPGIGAAKGAVVVNRSISTVMKTGAVKNLAIPSKVLVAATAGAIEAGISASPRLAQDTYTPEMMLNEMKWGAGIGAIFPLAAPVVSASGKRVSKYRAKRVEIEQKIRAETEAKIDAYQAGRDKQLDTGLNVAPKMQEATPEAPVREFADERMKGLNPKVMDGESDATKLFYIQQHGIDIVDESEMSQLLVEIDSAIAPPKPTDPTGAKNAESSASQTAKTEASEPPMALSNDDLNHLDNLDEGLPVAPKSPETIKKMKSAKKETRKALEFNAEKRVDKLLSKLTVPYERSASSATVDATTAGLSKSMTQTMLESNSPVYKFIGSELLELPEGYGGKILRKPSAALQQHSLKTRYLTQTQPSYHKLVGEYVAEQGRGALGKFTARHMDGQANTQVKQFSRDIATVLEQRRQGKAITVKSPSVLKMVDEVETSMEKMYTDLVEAGVSGFKKDRRIKHYFPQLWDDGGIRGATTRYGRERVQQLLAKGYMSSKHNKIDSMAEAMHVADNFLDNIKKDIMPDGAMPATMDARAKTRLDIDTTVTDGDLSIMDLLETDVSTVTAKYANRAAGQVALANKGIKSELDIAELRKRVGFEDLQMFDDAFDIMMGRPTQGGLNPAVAEIKDAISLSKMGGLGMAQLAEAGTELARVTMQLFNDPKVFKQMMGMSLETKAGKQLMRETQALSGISNDVHLLDRQATHLDRAAMDEVEGLRSTAYWLAGKATMGSMKAPAGYILGQASGFNMIRRFERRVANASFLLDASKTFKDGTGVMSPERLKDLGLDPNDKQLKNIFRNTVEYNKDGTLKTLNLDQWPKATRERLHLAMYRDDAQVVQQSIGGEMPAHINKPMMTVLLQFKQSAILANKKQAVRSMQFADKEAALGTLMNTAMAAMTRTAKFGTLGAAAYVATGGETPIEKPWEKDYWQPEKYVANFGFFPDMGHMAYDSYKAYDEGRLDMNKSGLTTVAEGVAGEIPVMGWMKDYYDLGTADSNKQRAEAAKGLMLLGNMQFADIIYKGLEAQLED